jgi:hypothetical protein
MILSNKNGTKLLGIVPISGFRVGFEWDWENYCVTFDVGIVRFTLTYKNPYATAH